jgi:hypothetical protein
MHARARLLPDQDSSLLNSDSCRLAVIGLLHVDAGRRSCVSQPPMRSNDRVTVFQAISRLNAPGERPVVLVNARVK